MASSYLLYAVPAIAIGLAGVGYLVYRRCSITNDGSDTNGDAASSSSSSGSTSSRGSSFIDFSSLDVDCTPSGLFSALLEIFQKPILRVPICVDLPRLARKMTLVDPHGVALVQADEDADEGSRAELIRTIIVQLGRLLGDDMSAVEERFSEFVSDKGDMASGLMRLVQEVMVPLAEPLTSAPLPPTPTATTLAANASEPRCIRVLRGCNQAALAPAVMRLKKSIAFQYKDKRSSWTLDIEVRSTSVVVTHRKIEEAWLDRDETPEEHSFEFMWSLVLTFERHSIELQSAQVIISHVTFPDTVSQRRRHDVIEALSKCPFAKLQLTA